MFSNSKAPSKTSNSAFCRWLLLTIKVVRPFFILSHSLHLRGSYKKKTCSPVFLMEDTTNLLFPLLLTRKIIIRVAVFYHKIITISRRLVYFLFAFANSIIRYPRRLRQVLFAKRVPVKQEVKPPVAVWLEQTVR